MFTIKKVRINLMPEVKRFYYWVKTGSRKPGSLPNY